MEVVKTNRLRIKQSETRIPLTAKDRREIDIYIRKAKNGNQLLLQKNISPATLKTILVNGYAYESQYKLLHEFITSIKISNGIKD